MSPPRAKLGEETIEAREDKIAREQMATDEQSEDEGSVQEYDVKTNAKGRILSRERISGSPKEEKKVDFLNKAEDAARPDLLDEENQLKQRIRSQSASEFPERKRSGSVLVANSNFKPAPLLKDAERDSNGSYLGKCNLL